MTIDKKHISELYNWLIKNFSESVDDWSKLRKTKLDSKISLDNFGAPGRTIFKQYISKETKLITILSTSSIKLRLEIFETNSESGRKKVITLKYGGAMSAMEDMMFEQYSYRADRRSLQKGVGKMLKHLLDKKFIR